MMNGMIKGFLLHIHSVRGVGAHHLKFHRVGEMARLIFLDLSNNSFMTT